MEYFTNISSTFKHIQNLRLLIAYPAYSSELNSAYCDHFQKSAAHTVTLQILSFARS